MCIPCRYYLVFYCEFNKKKTYFCSTCVINTMSFHRPVVDIGFSDKTLEVQSLDLESESPARGIVRGTLTVIGHELGSKLICLDSVANPK